MKAYNVIVRPAGQVTHEVPRHKISAKEVLMLRHVHGRDAVIKIEEIGSISDYDEMADYRNMAFAYGGDKVQRLFGVFPESYEYTEEVDPKEYITNFDVIVQEARQTSIKEIVAEAGTSGDAPPPTGDPSEPLYVGDPESQQAAKSVHQSVAME